MNQLSIGERGVLKFLEGLTVYTTDMPERYHNALSRIKEEGLLEDWFEKTQTESELEF